MFTATTNGNGRETEDSNGGQDVTATATAFLTTENTEDTEDTEINGNGDGVAVKSQIPNQKPYRHR
jgi:hypothetical protein